MSASECDTSTERDLTTQMNYLQVLPDVGLVALTFCVWLKFRLQCCLQSVQYSREMHQNEYCIRANVSSVHDRIVGDVDANLAIDQ